MESVKWKWVGAYKREVEKFENWRLREGVGQQVRGNRDWSWNRADSQWIDATRRSERGERK